MAGWKLGMERRVGERFQVEWAGTLTCIFPDAEENVEVRVSEVSATGARLVLESLKVGQNHIVIGSESSEFILSINLPDASLSTPVRIIWYSSDADKERFNLGVLFIFQSAEERRMAIEAFRRAEIRIDLH